MALNETQITELRARFELVDKNSGTLTDPFSVGAPTVVALVAFNGEGFKVRSSLGVTDIKYADVSDSMLSRLLTPTPAEVEAKNSRDHRLANDEKRRRLKEKGMAHLIVTTYVVLEREGEPGEWSVFCGRMKETDGFYCVLHEENYCREFLHYLNRAKRMAKTLLHPTREEAIAAKIGVFEARKEQFFESIFKIERDIATIAGLLGQ